MMRLSYAFAVFAIVCIVHIAFSGESKIDEPLHVTIELVDGSRIIGEPATSSIAIQTNYGTLDIPLNHIRRIQFEKKSNRVVVEMRNSDRISGISELKSLGLSSAIGRIKIEHQFLKELSVDTVMPPGIISKDGASIRYEAENAALSGGAAVHVNHSGYSGTGFVDGYFGTSTATTTFAVNVPSTGSYNVTLRYSSGYGNSTNTGLYVNGTKIKDIICISTGTWDSWGNETAIVTLKRGSNTIVYKADSSSGICINLDYIDISSSGEKNTPAVSL
jgi:hypothetical protein